MRQQRPARVLLRVEDADLLVQLLTHDPDRRQQVGIIGDHHCDVEPAHMGVMEQVRGQVHVRALLFHLDDSRILLRLTGDGREWHGDRIRVAWLPDTTGFFFGVIDGTEQADDLDAIATARQALNDGLTVSITLGGDYGCPGLPGAASPLICDGNVEEAQLVLAVQNAAHRPGRRRKPARAAIPGGQEATIAALAGRIGAHHVGLQVG